MIDPSDSYSAHTEKIERELAGLATDSDTHLSCIINANSRAIPGKLIYESKKLAQLYEMAFDNGVEVCPNPMLCITTRDKGGEWDHKLAWWVPGDSEKGLGPEFAIPPTVGYKNQFPLKWSLTGCGKCEICKKRKRGKLIQRAMLDTIVSGPVIMVTLTFHQLARFGRKDLKRAADAFWKNWKERAKRRGLDPAMYMAFEGEEKSHPHFHFIIFGMTFEQAVLGMLTDAEIRLGEDLYFEERGRTGELFKITTKGATTHHHPMWAYGRMEISRPQSYHIAYVVKYLTKEPGVRNFWRSIGCNAPGDRYITEIVATLPGHWEEAAIATPYGVASLNKEFRGKLCLAYKNHFGYLPYWAVSREPEMSQLERIARNDKIFDKIDPAVMRDLQKYFSDEMDIRINTFDE